MQHGRNMKTTGEKTWENTRLLKRFGKQHGRNMKATGAKTWENTRLLKRFGKQHGRNMKATGAKTWEKHWFIETVWKATWTEHESNRRKNPGETPGS